MAEAFRRKKARNEWIDSSGGGERNVMQEKTYVTRSFLPPFEEYVERIRPLWESRWLTNMGEYHQELERQLKAYLGVPEVSLTANGHLALELAIQAMEFPEGSEIITTPFTFISTTHAIIRNHMTPVFCDIKWEDGTLDESKLDELITEKTVAILPVHVYGNLCDIDKIQKIADKYGLKVIYDAAHAFGETWKGIGIGNFGDASIFSFHATKVFHTIEGGAITFSEHALYEKFYNLKNFGIRDEEHVIAVGGNAKLNEFSSIMGLCNLEHIEKVISVRRRCHERYCENLERVKNLHYYEKRADIKYNYAYFPVLIEGNESENRDAVHAALESKGIYSRKYFYPMVPVQDCFGDKYSKWRLPVAENISKKVLVLPLHQDLSMETIDFICYILAEVLGKK